MKRDFGFGLCALIGLAVILCVTAIASDKSDENGASIYLTEIPRGYRDFELIAVSRLTRSDGSSQLRAELGNGIAINAYREGKLPFPDGAIVAALHWNEVSSLDNDNVLAKGFPGAGIQSFIPARG
jgi:hypothetical protein